MKGDAGMTQQDYAARKRDDNPRNRVLLVALMAAILPLFVFSVVLAQSPDPGWVNVSLLLGERDDCSGSDAQTNAPEVPPCQTYSGSLYESLTYVLSDTTNAEAVDIEYWRVGIDADYLYLEWDLVGTNVISASAEHHYVVEIDLPEMGALGEGHQADFYVAFQGKTDFEGVSWLDANGPGYSSYKDAYPPPVAGAYPAAPDPPEDQDGYETKRDETTGRVFGRIFGDKVQMAISWSLLDLAEPPAEFRTRGWTSQSSLLAPDKLTWHDEHAALDLFTNSIDSVDWLTTGPTAISISAFEVSSPAPGSSPVIFLAFGVLLLISLALLAGRLRSRA